jgi:hypothetical protein
MTLLTANILQALLRFSPNTPPNLLRSQYLSGFERGGVLLNTTPNTPPNTPPDTTPFYDAIASPSVQLLKSRDN